MSIRKILISQPQPISEAPYTTLTAKYGVDILFHPLVKVEALTSEEYRAQKNPPIVDYTVIIFTSRHAIDHFFGLCKALRVPISENLRYYCVSDAVGNYLQNYIPYRRRKILIGKDNTFEGLKPVIKKHPKEKYFVPLGEGHTDEIIEFLTQAKVVHASGVMYRTVSNTFPPNLKFDFDLIIFFTPAGVKALTELMPDFKQGDCKITCFGPMTAAAIERANLRLDLQAPTPDVPSIPAAVEYFLK